MSIELDSYVTVPAMTDPKSRPENTIRSLAEQAKDSAEQISVALGIKGFRTADMKSLREMLFVIYSDTKLRQLAEMIGVNADLPREILALFKANDRESAAAP